MHRAGKLPVKWLAAGMLTLSAMGSVCARNTVAQEQGADASQNPSKAPDHVQSPTQAQNQEEITAVPNRPTFATTAETVQRGVLEIEYGFEGGEGHQNINGLVKWGAFKNLELRFANNPVERDAGVTGWGDSGAGFKCKVFPQTKKTPTISVLYAATVPTATSGLGANASGHSVQVLLSKDFGKHHFDFNEGVQFIGRSGASGFDRNYFTSLSYAYALTKKWGWTGEVAGFSWTNAATPATLIVLLAPTYSPTPRLVLDGGAYFAAYGNLRRVTFFVGVTYAIADLYHLHSAHKAAKK